MQMSCRNAVVTGLKRTGPWLLALSVSLALGVTANAASFGHSRLLSASGQPLRIDVPIRQLTEQDIQVLTVGAVPVALWQQAGLTPPVELSSMRFELIPGVDSNSRIVQVISSQPFSAPVADLLLEVRTASGQQQYQVSLLASGAAGATTPPQTEQPAATATRQGESSYSQPVQARPAIQVRRGDTLSGIARANRVQGFSIYQLMIALQQANPHAFINDNLNLVRAGATLTMPDAASLGAITDQEARRIFQEHAHAFASYRQNIAALPATAVQPAETAKGAVTTAGQALPAADAAPKTKDLVVLSSAPASAEATADDRLATGKNIQETDKRISQLEENVKSLNQALQSQGEAAKDAVFEGALSISQSIADITGTGEPDGDKTAADSNTQTANNGAEADSETDASGAPSASASPALPASTQAAASPELPVGSSTDTGKNLNSPDLTSNRADKPVSWIQQNLLGVITAILALIVLIVAWVLRRANASSSAPGQPPITEAMVKEQLEKINLDLQEAPSDDPPSRQQ